MLGEKSVYADECYKGNFIGADFSIDIDLSGKLSENWREFNQKFIPSHNPLALTSASIRSSQDFLSSV